MSRPDPTPIRGTANPRGDQDLPTVHANLVDDLLAPRTHSGLARGIVWADILAEIAVDERARHLRDAA